MLRLLALLFLSLSLLIGQDKPEQAAQKPLEDWLALVDAADYGASWDHAADSFKAQVTKQQWTDAVKEVRDKTGKCKSRSLKSATYTQDVPGAPKGEYVIFEYGAIYDSGAFTETAVAVQEKAAWKVGGYFVKAAQ